MDPNMIEELAHRGADVSKELFNAFVTSIRLQEELFEANKVLPTAVFSGLGWIDVPDFSNTGQVTGFTRCYRLNELIGGPPAENQGTWDVKPRGDFNTWKELVINEVVGHSALELVLIASLASIPLALLSESIGLENPIVHLNYGSGQGKTTAAVLGNSAFGKAYDGTTKEYDKYGQVHLRRSTYQSWGATDNALVNDLSGNAGVVTILNELGKYLGKDATRLVFDFSEGSDKKRMNYKISERYSTVIISTGEASLLDKCKSKLEGLRIRVMELRKPLTDSAEHSNKIKATCLEHCGHAAPMVAKYIMDQGGTDYVLGLYNEWKTKLIEILPQSYNMERFVEKFAALFMASADICSDALGIEFDKKGLQQLLIEYDAETSDSRSSSAESYDILLEECRINLHRFHVGYDKSLPTKIPHAEQVSIAHADCWGRVTYMRVPYPGGRVVVQEFEIRQGIVQQILAEHGFTNIKTCEQAWRAAEVLNARDDTHPCHRRKIDPQAPTGSRENVYVLRVFCDPDDLEEQLEAIRKAEEAEEKRKNRIKLKSNLIQFDPDPEPDPDSNETKEADDHENADAC